MLEVSKNRYAKCTTDGNNFESLFKQKVIELGHNYKKSSQEDDWYKHIDCYVDGYGVDVKGNRYLNTIWLEYSNVNGNKGWLRGDAMYIAMHINELYAFSVFYRKDLLQFVRDNVSEKTNNKRDYLKYYTREKWGKKDLLVKVKYSDIKHLELSRI